MSCWVVPSLAAELWHIPLEQVWRRIRAGEIPSRQENGFTFVDVAPYGPRVTRPNLPPAERPATFATADVEPDEVTEEEAVALSAAAADSAAATATTTAAPPEEDERGPEDDTASKDLGDWRAARRRNARLRVPPLKWRLSA
jgi:hypothetical protein